MTSRLLKVTFMATKGELTCHRVTSTRKFYPIKQPTRGKTTIHKILGISETDTPNQQIRCQDSMGSKDLTTVHIHQLLMDMQEECILLR